MLQEGVDKLKNQGEHWKPRRLTREGHTDEEDTDQGNHTGG